MEPRKELSKEPKGNAPASTKMAGEVRKPDGGGGAASAAAGKNQAATGSPGKNQQAAGQATGSTGTNQPSGGANAGEQDLLQHAKNASSAIVSQVQTQAGSKLNQQKESAATDLSKVVNAVRRFGETLSAEETGPIGRYAAEYGDKAAESLERFSNYIRQQDPKQLLNDVQNFGRRRPALLLGGAFLLGFAGARLIKSSMDSPSHTPNAH